MADPTNIRVRQGPNGNEETQYRAHLLQFANVPKPVVLPRRRSPAEFRTTTGSIEQTNIAEFNRMNLSAHKEPLYSPHSPRVPPTFVTLPPELQISIFKDLLSPYNTSYTRSILHQRTTLLLLSRQIHDLVMATPSLWAFVSISGPIVNHTMTKRLLERSGGAGLWWVFDLRNNCEDTWYTRSKWCTSSVLHTLFETYLLPTITRTTKLHIIIDSPPLFHAVFTSFRGVPSPLLKELKIVTGKLNSESLMHTYKYDPPTTTSPARELELVTAKDMLGGRAPHLDSVSIHCASITYLHAILQSLENRQATEQSHHVLMQTRINLKYLDLSMQNAMEAETFYDIMDVVAPTLEFLVLRNGGPVQQLRLDSTTNLPYRAWNRSTAQRSDVVSLPSLTGLVIGGMITKYLGSLLFILSFPLLSSLGIHGVRAQECEGVWNLLSQFPVTPLLSHPKEASMHRTHALQYLRTLELFDIDPSWEILRDLNANKDDFVSLSGYRSLFREFLGSLPSLTELRMRKVGIRLLTALSGLTEDSSSTSDHPVPNLERLEVSCITYVLCISESGDENQYSTSDTWNSVEEAIPLKPRELGRLLLRVLESRARVTNIHGKVGGIRRLHLDGDEWAMQRGSKEEFLAQLAELDEAPLIHWDARAPFFADYYDSTEI
ncbi:hypothetical protein M408DRAFT_233509 [Serendipita vermifera MAFF 305830]|uniref:Uncharacterized protein n=1 Tax=Serendipita vermifera MAFF 305830 TaxID=933852 RepID=A0A0C3AYR7_SERVB|nr:hypothetical protein M408DRAFT_233509 [Serendipita vermifera MAFF 305830]